MDEKKEKKLRKYFDMFLQDFSSDKDPKVQWDDLGNGTRIIREFRIPLSPELHTSKPYIVFIIFVYLKEFSFSGKWEKVAWEIPIKYKDKPFILTHRKFGFRIIANDDEDLTRELAIEAMTQIHKSINYAEKLIEPYIKQKVNNGNITLDNEYGQIRRRFTFFRKEAQKAFNVRNDKANYQESLEKYYEESEKGLYYTSAMLDAFYSLLEQTFVLLIPFIDDASIDNLIIEDFILNNWKEKYKVVFELSNDVEANKHLDKLIQLKEQFRNPLAHGNFLKEGGSFKVHMEHLGIIPMNLTKVDKQLAYSFKGLNEIRFDELCETLDNFERFLVNHERTKFGMIYIQNDLPVPFDENTRKRNLIAMTCDESFEEYIHYIKRTIDDGINMDW